MDTTTKLKVGFAALMILSGIGVASYPVISNAVAQRHASEAIQNYDDTVKSMDTEKLDAAKEAARRYNQQLDSAVERDAAGEAEDTGTSYVDLVDVGESLGYITIPKIDVNLPIYEGTSDDVLQRGVGHLEGSSYPLGGESTHSVLTGHRGLPEAVLFTDLDKLEEGDCFYLHILDETLAYQVDQIKVVEPEHTEDLDITAGQDYCTLVTCTPYAINTHRMLVRGTRIPYNGEEETNTPQAVQYQALRTGTVVKRVVDAWPWIAVTGSIVIGGEALLLSEVAEPPAQMVDSLTTLFKTLKTVKRAFLCSIKERADAPANLLIGIEAEGDIEAIIQTTGRVATDTLPGDEPIDICQVVEGEKGISHFMIAHITPFYEKRWGSFLRDFKQNRII